MQNQALKSEFTAQKIVLITLAIVVGLVATGVAAQQLQMVNPYVRQVLALNGNVDMGKAMFQMNCAGCHGIEAYGQVGPSLRDVSNRRSRISLIHQITSGETPPMPKFQASPQEMADLLSYLQEL